MRSEIETPHNFTRDILRGILSPMFGGVERNDANRVTVLAGHQVVDGGFQIGLADVRLGECGARCSVIVDDEIEGLIVAARHNRRNKAPVHKNSKRNGYPENLSTKSGRRNRS